jgi:hypothetical protein
LGLNRDDSIPSLHYIDSEDADRDIERARVLERDSSKEVYILIYDDDDDNDDDDDDDGGDDDDDDDDDGDDDGDDDDDNADMYADRDIERARVLKKDSSKEVYRSRIVCLYMYTHMFFVYVIINMCMHLYICIHIYLCILKI